jgi:hypothetical protein
MYILLTKNANAIDDIGKVNILIEKSNSKGKLLATPCRISLIMRGKIQKKRDVHENPTGARSVLPVLGSRNTISA